MIRPGLLAAYRNTVYRAGDASVRPGRRCAAMDRLLLAHGVRQAALISADNPYSRRMPAGWNRRMRLRLAEALRRRRVLPAAGCWRGWSEAHCLVFGDPAPAIRLVRRFRQNAIVIVGLRQPARILVVY